MYASRQNDYWTFTIIESVGVQNKMILAIVFLASKILYP